VSLPGYTRSPRVEAFRAKKRRTAWIGVEKASRPSILGLAHRLTSVDTPICQAQFTSVDRPDEVQAMAARVRWCVLLAGVSLLVGARSAHTSGRMTCVPIRTDETVASVAERVTGDARNMQASWFQIVNPMTSRPVPKTRYGFIFAGWNACTTRDDALPEVAIQPAAVALSTPAVARVPPKPPVAATAATVVVWAPAAIWSTVVLALALSCWLADEYLAGRSDRLRAMKLCAERFVEEFERPLRQPHLSRRPIQSRVRFKPGRARFDVLLAPDAGLRYPNLTDHKGNVMYDVVRIQRALSEHAFVSSRPYARGRWVVVPFRFRV
jgi:hypothetical protein